MDQKDEVIAALQEMVSELTNKLINLRVGTGLKIKQLNAEIETLKGKHSGISRIHSGGNKTMAAGQCLGGDD